MTTRPCSRATCNDEAVVTLTYDYADSLVVVGPLSLGRQPHTYDLCERHSASFSAPRGWHVSRHVFLGHDL
jgi:hypothetical protein